VARVPTRTPAGPRFVHGGPGAFSLA
jgi:hypothetical protein